MTIHRTVAAATLVAAGLAALAPAPAAAQSRIAFSESNGVEVVALGSPWCGETLSLRFRLTATSPLRDPDALAAFAPRLAPVFANECPQARAALLQLEDEAGAALPGAAAYRLSAADDWALRPAPAAGTETPGAASAADAAAREPEPDLDARFLAASQITDDDFFDALFHFAPQFADLSRFPGSAMAMAAIHDCQGLRAADSGDEFARRRLEAEMPRFIDAHRADGPEAAEREFILRFDAALGEYDFDAGAFSLDNPFGARLVLGTVDAARGCNAARRDGPPTRKLVAFGGDDVLDSLPMSAEAAQAYLEDMRRRNYNRREVTVVALARITGFEPDGRDGLVRLEPTAVRLVHATTRATLMELGPRALAEARAEAAARRAEAERLAALEARRAALARMEAERERAVERFEARLERATNPAHRLFLALGPEDAEAPSSDHPSRIAARAERAEEGRPAVVLFRAERSRDGVGEARWPQPLTVEIRDRRFEGELQRGAWYAAYGEIGPDPDASARGGLLPARLRADWLHACEDEGCVDDAETDRLVDAFAEGLDARIAEETAALALESEAEEDA